MSDVIWRESRYVQVPLSQDEVAERGSLLAKLIQDGAELAAAHKTRRDAMKEEMAVQEGHIARTAAVVNTRLEERAVPVECRLNVALGMVEEVRVDTGEVLLTRAAEAKDKARMQGDMFGEAGSA